MNARASGIAIWLIAAGSGAAFAQGGPPLITDDPGTPGNNHWEINFANISEFGSPEKLDQFPYFDLNYGAGDHVQLKLEGGWGYDWDSGASAKAGGGNLLAGIKWRFFDQDKAGFDMSTYPQFSFHPLYSSKDPAIAASGNEWLLPIEASKSLGPWSVNPELGYAYATRGPDSWFYGIVGDYAVRPDFELLAELHGDAFMQGVGSDLLFNLGLRYPFAEWLSLLLSIGHTIKITDGEEPQYLGYLGLQFRL